MEQVRKLPIGIQSFEIVRKNGYQYVDKTAMIYRLVSTDYPYFLSRPRRYLRFDFMTGVTKFAQVSVFSDLNQLVDNIYRLGFPNEEVRYGFIEFLVPYYTAVTVT